MGFGLPAAIGAKIAQPQRPAVVLSGDGGFLFNCQELAVAVQFCIPLVVLLFNDNAYGVLRPQQHQRFGRTNEIDLVNPDFVKMARAFGAQAQRVSTIDELGPTLSTFLGADGPFLIEIPFTFSWPPLDPSARTFQVLNTQCAARNSE